MIKTPKFLSVIEQAFNDLFDDPATNHASTSNTTINMDAPHPSPPKQPIGSAHSDEQASTIPPQLQPLLHPGHPSLGNGGHSSEPDPSPPSAEKSTASAPPSTTQHGTAQHILPKQQGSHIPPTGLHATSSEITEGISREIGLLEKELSNVLTPQST